MEYKKWTEEDFHYLKKSISEGVLVDEVMNKLNRSFDSIKKKLLRETNTKISKLRHKKESKHVLHNWNLIQKHYDSGMATLEIRKKFKLTPQAIMWGQKNNKFKTRNKSEASRLRYADLQINPEYTTYRNQCKFRFNVFNYPNEFELELIKKWGFYSPTNKKNNLEGISRDHIYTVYDGYVNKIDPKIIAHPANCQLIKQSENSRKHKKSAISLVELKKKIDIWNLKYKAG